MTKKGGKGGEVEVIQIDMPMPTNCYDCPACNDLFICAIPRTGAGWGENYVREFSNSRPEWCPMKEQKKQQFFVDESGKITPLPVVVRCEDCKHNKRFGGLYGCEFGNGLHDKDWYCADGERESEDD